MGLGIIAIALLLCFQFFMMRKMYYYHVIYLIREIRKDSSFEFFWRRMQFSKSCIFNVIYKGGGCLITISFYLVVSV